MTAARKPWQMAVYLVLILILGTTITVRGQEPTEGDPLKGGRLYAAWDIVLGVELPIESHQLWVYEDELTPSSWRCVNCHDWDYQGKRIRVFEEEEVDGDLSVGDPVELEYPSLLSMFADSEEDIIKWLDGTNSRDHDFSRYLSPEAMLDLSAFLSAGVIAPNLVADPNSGVVSGSSALGEDLYKQGCRECHGPEGAKINFGTISQPWFLGNVGASNPWRAAHIVRFGHTKGEFDSTGNLGWSFNQQIDLLAYLQILPAAYLQENNPVEVIDFSDQGNTTPLLYAAIGLGVVIFGGVGLTVIRERLGSGAGD